MADQIALVSARNLAHDMCCHHVGLLAALYEYKVFVQSATWSMNAVDQ